MTATSPLDGDLVVRAEQGPRNQPVFVLTPVAGRWETTCLTYDEAVHVAQRTALVYRSAIWFTKDGVTFDLVCSHRVDS
jgi:hypothetical protein